jgi:predicted dehydrogenase
MSHNTLRLGFIGGGLNSAIGKTHMIAAQMDNRWKVESGCFSRDTDVNTQTGQAWRIADNRIYSHWKEFITQERSSLDCVVILTPIPSHTEIILTALNDGLNVISEKPLTGSVADAQRIHTTAQANQCFVGVTYNYTGYPMLRELKRMIAEGVLGRIHQINIQTPLEGYLKLDNQGNPFTPQSWRLIDKDNIPTISLDLGTHAYHMIHFLTGESPVEVVSTKQSFGNFDAVIDNVSSMANFTNQTHCNVWYSKSALGHSNGLRIWVYGQHGSAEWFQMEPEYLNFNDQQGRRYIIDRANPDIRVANQERYTRFKPGHPAGFIEAFANYYYDLADSLTAFRSGQDAYSEYVHSIDVSIDILKIMEAMDRSAETRKWEAVE